MIYTSYYSKNANHPKAIGISCILPTRYRGKLEVRIDLAPTWDMVDRIKKGIIDEEQYTIEYVKLLASRKINWNSLITELDERVLLCYEKTGEFCHRHILADILEYYGAKVVEI